jgi:hypothetical protein
VIYNNPRMIIIRVPMHLSEAIQSEPRGVSWEELEEERYEPEL